MDALLPCEPVRVAAHAFKDADRHGILIGSNAGRKLTARVFHQCSGLGMKRGAGFGQGEAAVEQKHELVPNQRGHIPFLRRGAVRCDEGAQDIPHFRGRGGAGIQSIEYVPLSAGEVQTGQCGIELRLQRRIKLLYPVSDWPVHESMVAGPFPLGQGPRLKVGCSRAAG